MIASLWIWLIDFVHTMGYPGLLFATFIENIIPPVPSEVIMPLGGYLASIGKMNIFLVIIIGALGSTLGTLPYFYLGRYLSRHRIADFVEKYGKWFFYSKEKLDTLYDIFNHHNKYWIFFARFIPGARTLISLPAWSADMDIRWFLLLTYAGSTIWISIWTVIGYVLGKQEKTVASVLDNFSSYLIYIIIMLTVTIIVRRIIKGRISKK